MASKEGLPLIGGSSHWMKNIGCKVPMTICTVIVMVILWESPPPSILSYSSLSASQIQTILGRPASNEYSNPNKKSIESPNALAEEITELVEDFAAEDAGLASAPDQYIIPLLSHQVGNANQLAEYKSAATVARMLNRTLCLVPFFTGPKRHAGALADKNSFIFLEERYDPKVLNKYVNVMTLDECVEKCEHRLDDFWQLRHHSGGPALWDRRFNDTPPVSFDYNKEYDYWKSSAAVAAGLAARNDAKCVGLGGLWPGFQSWRGTSYAVGAYMQHSKKIMKAADLVQKRALGSSNSKYMAVHWRFEEADCRGHPFGLCFPRTSAGNVIMNMRDSETWNNMTREEKRESNRHGFNGVSVSKEDISGALYDRAVHYGLNTVYISTDGWLRGPESGDTLKWVVKDLRNKGFIVAGLWMVEGLPNFNEYFYVHPVGMPDLFGVDERVSSHMIALVEQELCVRASVFVGSGQSSWSLAVASMRRGRLLKQQFKREIAGSNLGSPPAVLEQAVIEKILEVQWTTADHEAPDGWLDYDACEDRLLHGVGHCKRITT